MYQRIFLYPGNVVSLYYKIKDMKNDNRTVSEVNEEVKRMVDEAEELLNQLLMESAN